MSVKEWYKNHKQDYDRIESRLNAVKRKFLNANKETQRDMFFTSLEFAVISIQTKVDIHEEAFRQLKETDKHINDCLSSTVYPNNKTDWLKRSRLKLDKADKAINLLEKGEIDNAHRFILDEFVGVSTVKSAFTLCMLGFTQKACIDSNVKIFAGDNADIYDGVVISKYNQCCKNILDVNGLEDKSLFMRQWITFDFIRNVNEQHNIYFKHQLDR